MRAGAAQHAKHAVLMPQRLERILLEAVAMQGTLLVRASVLRECGAAPYVPRISRGS